MRPVTQGDVIRADAKDIPRIFQVNFGFEVLDFLANFSNPWSPHDALKHNFIFIFKQT